MKSRYIAFIIFFCSVCHLVFSQQKINVDITEKPINELFDLIENQSVFKVYCLPQEMDSLKVSVDVIQGEPAEILREALKNTVYQVSVYENSIFVLNNKKLITSLPEVNELLSDTRQVVDSVMYANSLSFEQKQDKIATSEYKVYEIGNASLPKKDKVNLSGYVLNSKTGETVPGVVVLINGTNIVTTTNHNGYYTIDLPPGRHDVTIDGGGQMKSKRQIQIHSDGNLDIQSIEKVYSLKEVEVLANRRHNVKEVTMGVELLKMKEIKNIPTAFGEADIIRVVMSLPGVKSVGEVSSGFNVRGGATDQNLILFNDATIYNPSHLFGLFSAFNPDLVKDMELYKSSIPSKYGGRISSVLDIRSREGNMKKYTGSASIGLLTSRLTVEGPTVKDKGAIMLGARTTYSDWLLKQLPEKSGYRDGSAEFHDLNLGITHNFNSKNTVFINGYYSKDNFRFQQNEQYDYRNANASAKWRHVFTPKLTGTFVTGYDHYDYTTRNTLKTAMEYDMKFAIDQIFFNAGFNWYFNDKHSLNLGLNTLHYNLTPGEYLPYGEGSLVEPDRIQKEKALETAIYIGDQWEVTPKLSIDAGLRYSMFNVLGPRTYNVYYPGYLPSESSFDQSVSEDGIIKTYHSPEFRLSGRYLIDNTLSVKMGINSMSQFIHKISNTSIMSPTDTWKLSDVNIKPQKGIQFAAGIYKNLLSNTVEASIEAYYKTMSDYLDYKAGAQLEMNHHLEMEVLNVSGRAYGVELMLKKNLGKLNGWVSYTYSRTQLRQDDKRIPLPVNDGDWYSADFDKPHEFKLIGNYKFTHRYSASFNCEYSTGRPITLPVAKYDYAGGEFVYYSDRNKYRVPDYFRVDLSFNIEPSHHLTLLTHSMITFGVYNLTGRKNAHSIYYVSEKGKIKGYQLSIFGAPIPYVSYNIKF